MKFTLTGLLLVTSVNCESFGRRPLYKRETSVKVKNGTLQGVHSSSYNQDFFLGVPYAQPPLGELRFQNPQSINTSFNSTYEATEYPPSCYGYGSDNWGLTLSEDCLYLNVVRPAGIPENTTLPVAVWIHGGGLYEGSTVDQRYNLSYIVQNSVEIGQPMIAVSIQYRLSAWGFLGSQEALDQGITNVGFKDQRLSLHWINENIAAFGGDPSKVTIWGESAGGQSVGAHLLAYDGRDDGLFRAAIAESGGPAVWFFYQTLGGFNGTASQQISYNTLLNRTGCADIDCLRSLPSETINDGLNGTGTLLTPFGPIIDGDFIAKFPSDQLSAGDFVQVPLLIGTNTDEGTAFGSGYGPNGTGVNTDAEFADALASNGMDNATVAILEMLYPNIPAAGIPSPANYSGPENFFGTQFKRLAAVYGDISVIAPRRLSAISWAAQNTTVYTYRFDIKPPALPTYIGATHFQEVAFVFDSELGLGYSSPPITNNTALMAKLVSKSWVGFITALDPNENGVVGAPEWPKFVVNETLGVGKNLVIASDGAWVEWDDTRLAEVQFLNDNAKSQFGK